MSPEDLLAAADRHFALTKQPLASGASVQELAELAAALGGPLPRELEQWLGLCRGGYLEAGSLIHLSTPREMIETRDVIMEVYDKPACWLPIGVDGGGSLFCLVCPVEPLASAPVLFMDHETGETYLCGSSLFVFLRLALSGEDDAVFERERFFAVDPAAEQIPQYGYGWE